MSPAAPLLPDLADDRRGADTLRGRDDAPYHASDDLVAAFNAAAILGMPLLLTGEPGCGKTDFAFAVARHLAADRDGWAADHPTDGLLECYVRSDSRARDFLYHCDTVRRFADAQHGNRGHARDPRRYVTLRDLGLALARAAQGIRRVVLIDEIDKANRDLPNDLLRELDQGWFEVHEVPGDLGRADGDTADLSPRWPPAPSIAIRRRMGRARGAESRTRPLVIITSNEERQLPDAFLRRCIFHRVRFPGQTTLETILADRADGGTRDHIPAIVGTFLALRSAVALIKPPSTSELVNWFDALAAKGFRAAGGLLGVVQFARHVTPDDAGGWHKAGSDDAPPWRALPGLGCLIKLDADLKRLTAA